MRYHSIEDLRKAAKRKLPGVMFDFIEGGAEDEFTVAQNTLAFRELEFVPRVLRKVDQIDLSTNMLGVQSAMPIICAPTAMSRVFHYHGEKAVARAASEVGIPYCLSTAATTSIEDIAQCCSSPAFFQIYVWKNREMVEQFVARCESANYSGLMLAVDFPTLGKRERDLRNGHGHPFEQRLRTALGALFRPVWLFRFLFSEPMKMANMIGYLPHQADALKTVDQVNAQFDPNITWEDAKRLMSLWQDAHAKAGNENKAGAFVLKGIQSVADAREAVRMGATGIVLSNHGGRQLDGAPPAMRLLPDVLDAVGDDIEVLIDGGVRRGADIIKAVAMGAKGCLIGRPYLYGLAAAGETGVKRALGILQDEMERVMRLIGCQSVRQLDSSYVKMLNQVN